MADELRGLQAVRCLPIEGVEKILIRGPNWIGDAVMTLRALSAIRSTYAKARLVMLVKPWVADVYRFFPPIDEVLVYQRPGTHEGMKGLWHLAQELRGGHFDMAILLQNALEAAIIACLADIPIRAGYASDARGLLLTHGVKRARGFKKIHQTQYYFNLVQLLGCREGAGEPGLRLAREDEITAEKLRRAHGISLDRPLVGMAPGAAYGPAKQWFPERYAALADRLKEEFSAQVVLLGSRSDRRTSEAIKWHARHRHLDLAGKTDLRTAMALIAHCRVFIANDSGLMHIAGAFNVPTVAIFGSTDPKATSPVGENNVIICKSVGCSPCLKEKCPTDFQCMAMIGIDDVYSAAKGLLCAS